MYNVADAIVQCCGNSKTFGLALNVANPEVFDVRSWVEALGSIVGTSTSLVWLNGDEIELKIGAYNMPMYSYEPYTFDTTLIQNTIEWNATPCSTWLSSTVSWHLESYPGGASDGYSDRQAEVDLAIQNQLIEVPI